jgi:hypothetical protein
MTSVATTHAAGITTTTTRTRVLLTGGVLAGPLFVAVVVLQALTRDGFDPRSGHADIDQRLGPSARGGRAGPGARVGRAAGGRALVRRARAAVADLPARPGGPPVPELVEGGLVWLRYRIG